MTEDDARCLAERLYEGRFDCVGLPAIDHLRRVAERVSGRAKVVAWLHDAEEDGLIRRDELKALDLSLAERFALRLLNRNRTSLKGATYAEYVRIIAKAEGEAGEIACEVKLADLDENTTRPCPPRMLDMRRPGGRYPRAREVLLRRTR